MSLTLTWHWPRHDPHPDMTFIQPSLSPSGKRGRKRHFYLAHRIHSSPLIIVSLLRSPWLHPRIPILQAQYTSDMAADLYVHPVYIKHGVGGACVTLPYPLPTPIAPVASKLSPISVPF